MRIAVLALLLSGCASTLPTVAVTVVGPQRQPAALSNQLALRAWLADAFVGRERAPDYEADWICQVELPHPPPTDEPGWLDADIEVFERTSGRVLARLEARVPYDPDDPEAAMALLRDRLADTLGVTGPPDTPLLATTFAHYGGRASVIRSSHSAGGGTRACAHAGGGHSGGGHGR